MVMKKTTLLILAIMISQVMFGQVSGNVNYQNQVRFSDQNINVNTPPTLDVFISSKCKKCTKSN